MRFLVCGVLSIVAFATAVGTTSRSVAANARAGSWPAPELIDPRGRPEGQLVEQTARFYIFQTGDRWHVITASRNPKGMVFRGVISVDQGQIKAAVPVGNERRDSAQFSPSQQTIMFRFKTGLKADGFYFMVSRETTRIYFNLDAPQAKRMPQHIFIGEQKVNPAANPFVLTVRRGPAGVASTSTSRSR
jgi:hypothetical protein